jgi:steroid 5-alpha reductase family enzyme
MIHLFFESGLFIVGYMTLIFGLAILIKNNSIVDIFWGIGFILIMLFSSNFKISDYFATNLFNALILLWGFRLSIHIFIRNHSKDEDFRYKNWRNTWKYFYLRSF